MLPGRAQRKLFAVALVAAVSLTSCYQNPDPTGWDDKDPISARDNFVNACTHEVKAGGGTTSTIKIDDKSNCECIFDAMVKKYNLQWDDMKEYEKKQSDAKAGDEPPTPPKELTKAIKDCKPEGPGL